MYAHNVCWFLFKRNRYDFIIKNKTPHAKSSRGSFSFIYHAREFWRLKDSLHSPRTGLLKFITIILHGARFTLITMKMFHANFSLGSSFQKNGFTTFTFNFCDMSKNHNRDNMCAPKYLLKFILVWMFNHLR